MARSDVEAKNAVPFISADRMVVSTMRFSRSTICSIQRKRIIVHELVEAGLSRMSQFHGRVIAEPCGDKENRPPPDRRT